MTSPPTPTLHHSPPPHPTSPPTLPPHPARSPLEQRHDDGGNDKDGSGQDHARDGRLLERLLGGGAGHPHGGAGAPHAPRPVHLDALRQLAVTHQKDVASARRRYGNERRGRHHADGRSEGDSGTFIDLYRDWIGRSPRNYVFLSAMLSVLCLEDMLRNHGKW